MRLIELFEIARFAPESLQTQLTQGRWKVISDCYKVRNAIAMKGPKVICNFKVPEPLVDATLPLLEFQFIFNAEKGILRLVTSNGSTDETLDAVAVYQRFGGSALAVALENGAYYLSDQKDHQAIALSNEQLNEYLMVFTTSLKEETTLKNMPVAHYQSLAATLSPAPLHENERIQNEYGTPSERLDLLRQLVGQQITLLLRAAIKTKGYGLQKLLSNGEATQAFNRAPAPIIMQLSNGTVLEFNNWIDEDAKQLKKGWTPLDLGTLTHEKELLCIDANDPTYSSEQNSNLLHQTIQEVFILKKAAVESRQVPLPREKAVGIVLESGTTFYLAHELMDEGHPLWLLHEHEVPEVVLTTCRKLSV